VTVAAVSVVPPAAVDEKKEDVVRLVPRPRAIPKQPLESHHIAITCSNMKQVHLKRY
jgi:hypothetical protein